MSEWFSKHPKSTHLFVRHLTIYGSTGSGSISSTKVKDYPWSSRATSIMHNKNKIWPSTDPCLTGPLKLDWFSKHMGKATQNTYAGELEPKKRVWPTNSSRRSQGKNFEQNPSEENNFYIICRYSYLKFYGQTGSLCKITIVV